MEDKDFKLLLGRRIKQIRNAHGLTQESLCDKIGIEIPNLSNIETGKSYPSMQTFIKIIKAFNIEPNDMFDLNLYDNEETVNQLAYEYFQKLSLSKKNMVLKIISLINEEDKN